MRAIIVTAAVVSLFAGAASAQSAIRVGQTVNGELTASDARLDDGSYYDCYNIKPQAGQRIQIDQTSSAFDSYLSVVLGSCDNPTEMLATDDDSGGGLNSRLVLNADGREWAIVANSIEGGATGAYQLRVSVAGSGGGQASTSSNSGGGSRPAGGQERYDWDAMCKAVDTLAMIQEMAGMGEDALFAYLEDSDRLRQAALQSGRALGHSQEAVEDRIVTFGVAIAEDNDLYGRTVQLRHNCLAAL